MESILGVLSTWAADRFLRISPNKSELVFRLPVIFKDNYLGVILESRLKWKRKVKKNESGPEISASM